MSNISVHEETNLLKLVAEGDEYSFRTLFEHYYPLVYKLVHRFSLTPEELHDALQETFLQVWLQRDKLADVQNFKGWLLRIASRRCRELLRRNLLQEKIANSSEKVLNKIKDNTGPAYFEIYDLKRIINEAVNKLPDQRKRIFLLSREEGLKPVEIASMLSLSVSTVKNTLSAALSQIRDHLQASGYPTPMFFLVFLILE